MRSDRIGLGHLAAASGALVGLCALWLPWYELKIGAIFSSDEVKDGLARLPQGLGGFVDGLADLLPSSVAANGWQVMERTDVALAVIAAIVIVLFLAVASLGADGRSSAQLMALAAIVGLGLVVYKASNPGLPGDYVSVRLGVWVAGTGWAICLAGALFAGFRPPRAEAWAGATPASEPVWIAPDSSGSVPPPGS